MEIWRNVKGYEGLYQVSNYGEVKSLFRYKKILKKYLTKVGYYRVDLCKDKKNTHRTIHSIVAEAFLENVEGKKFVDHINGNKLDNRPENLRYVTPKENSNNTNTIYKVRGNHNGMYGKLGKLNHKSKPVIQYSLSGELVCEYEGTKDAERKTGYNCSAIAHCCRGDYKTYKGYIWRYKV